MKWRWTGSRSGYYAWLKRTPGVRAQANERLRQAIQDLFAHSRQSYGSPCMTAALRQAGQPCNHKRVERLMRQQWWRGRTRRRYRVVTTDSRHDQHIAPNRLAEQPTCTAPNQVWVTDITYVPIQEGWLYLAGVMDLYGRKWWAGPWVRVWPPRCRLAALTMALAQRSPGAGLLHHSGRGVQYASQDYRQQLAAFGLQASMSRPGNCYDNPAMESFWSTLKHELVYRNQFHVAPKPGKASLNGSKYFTTVCGSTARSTLNPLWTLKTN